MTKSFCVKGQGVFIFQNQEEYIEFEFFDKHHNNILIIEIFKQEVIMHINQSNKIYKTYRDSNNKTGSNTANCAYYWISINAQTQQIYVGIGEPRLETVIYSSQLEFSFKPFLESLMYFNYEKMSTTLLKVLKDPITRNLPLIVRDTNHLTMSDIAKGTYLPKANLSLISQKLYDCISGESFVLDDVDFPDFSKAIAHSILTPGLWCYNKLQSKSREFNPDHPNILETYLRITLGENNGESPGIPYVMEIWPSQHYSPVHSHAGASAIIRVLSGKIHVRLFPFLTSTSEKNISPFNTANFEEDDITWITPSLNQTHQLINQSEELCITIQCYMYESENEKHYDYFDYLDNNGNIQKYEPDSDMDYISFRELIQKEWEDSFEDIDEKNDENDENKTLKESNLVEITTAILWELWDTANTFFNHLHPVNPDNDE